MEPLSPEDATLLCATTEAAQLQIGALCRFDGDRLRDEEGRLRVEDLQAHVRSRLDRLPRFRQRLEHVPFDLARPVWVDDVGFDPGRHLRDAALPAPGGPAELRAFLGDLLGRPLDPHRPLWELWVVDGLAGGDVAVVLRVHHVMADGLSLVRAALALLDLEEDLPAAPPPPPWRPVPPPGPAALVVSGLVDRGRHQLALAVGTARRLLDPRTVIGLGRSVVAAVTSPPERAPDLPLTGRVGTRRDFVWTSLPLGRLHDLARARGTTLNDVVLALVSDALRRRLGPAASTGLSGRLPKVLVPIGDTSGEEGGNAFSFVVTALPVDVDRPVDALERIHRDMTERKSSRQASEALSLFSVVDVVPVPVLSRLAPEALARQPFVNLAVTNVPGSEVPLFLQGARLRELFPIVTGVGNIACIVGVLSYGDQLGVGITVDPDVVPDAEGLLGDVEAAAASLTGG